MTTPEQRAAFLTSQAACALIELEGMKAANEERRRKGFADAYGEEMFLSLIGKYGIHHNAALGTLGP